MSKEENRRSKETLTDKKKKLEGEEEKSEWKERMTKRVIELKEDCVSKHFLLIM